MPNSASFFAPGKLFLAGEYAVTAPSGEAIILPVRKGIKVTVNARKSFRIINRQYPNESMQFKELQVLTNPYLRLAMEVVRQWAMVKKIRWRPFAMTIDSSLVSQDGKYGLGSSGAVTVAVIGALLKFLGMPFTRLELYQLAVIATIQNYQDTSFGDVACSSFNQPIHYRKFAKDMVPLLKTLHVKNLLAMPWQDLRIEPIKLKMEKPLVVYSGTSADSHQMVKMVYPHVSTSWVKQSNAFVNQWRQQFSFPLVNDIHQHLKTLAKEAKAPIFTSGIQTILEVSHQLGGVGKISGAGGGDCVLVFLPKGKTKAFQQRLPKQKFKILSDII
jgi:phosphomevalonate kinase